MCSILVPPAALCGVVLLRIVGRGGVQIDGVGVALFATQLAVNLSWMSLYQCGLRKLAFFAIAAMVALTVSLAFWRAARDPVSAALLGPYLAWLMVAAHLNAAAVESRNRQ